jgi:hypothetical protein
MIINITKASMSYALLAQNAPLLMLQIVKANTILDILYFLIQGSGSYCVYCPSNGSLPCQNVEGYSASSCELAVACEFPDGTVEFGLSADDCRYAGIFQIHFPSNRMSFPE